ELAQIAQVDDFIVSDKFISLMLSQIAENKELNQLFADLLKAEGNEIYLKPAEDYVAPGTAVNFYTILESAFRRKELALGYKLQKYELDASKAFGVKMNPNKPETVTFSPGDKILVLAED
ncbi:MAG TPA: hypothetical protein V6D23_14005, partial [Candidatus Obscuribacterales bacterium]